MIPFRRSTSKLWARLFPVGALIAFAGLLVLLHFIGAPFILQVIFWIGTLCSSLFLVRLFIHAEDMFIEVSTDHLSWSCPLWIPRSASISISDIAELITTRDILSDSEPDCVIKMTNGSEVFVPAITGSIYPVITAIKEAKPDISTSSRSAKFHFRSFTSGFRFLLRGPSH